MFLLSVNLIILPYKERGFVELKQGKMHGDPDAYEGLCIDLIKRLSKDIKFKYNLSIVADGKYGSYDKTTKRWTGIVGELIDEVRFMHELFMQK